MIRMVLYLGILLVASCGLSATKSYAAEQTVFTESVRPLYFQLPYAQRYPMVEFLAKHFAGRRSTLFPERRGLWAGIYWQTKWQEDSARDQVGLWSVVNATLTIEPFYFAQDFQANIACKDSHLFDEYPETKTQIKIENCKLWYKYFQASRQTSLLTQARNQRYLWAAHTASISDILEVYAVDFAAMKNDLPYEEGAYWEGWIDLVYKLEEWNFSTTESSVADISQNMLAACSPLGAESCLIESLPNLRQQLLAYWLISGQGDIISLLGLP